MLRKPLILGLLLLGAGPLHAFTNGQNATYVLGQPDFMAQSNHATSASSLAFPNGSMAYDYAHQWLFVSDLGGNRVLVFNLAAGITNGMAASFVLGQPDFVSDGNNGNVAAANTMINPLGVAYDPVHQHLFVSDSKNYRILIFDLSGGISNGMNASWVLGQSTFTTNALNNGSATPVASGFGGQMFPAYDPVSQRLFVVDAANSRVLGFDLSGSTTTWDGMNASWVWGQSNFTSGTAGCTASTLNLPNGVTYDPAHQRLWVADAINYRVIGYDLSGNPSTWVGEAASWVLGHTNFTTGYVYHTTPAQNTFFFTSNVSYDPVSQQLFVSDIQGDRGDNNRVMIFDLSGVITNGMNATSVLGAPNFTSPYPYAVNQSYISNAEGALYDPVHQRLFVNDMTLYRILVFTNPLPPPPVWCNGQNASNVLGQMNFTSNAANLTSQSGMTSPAALAYDAVYQRLFVPDTNNNRVMVYSFSGAVTNDMNAAYVLGQPNFNSGGINEGAGFNNPTANSMAQPNGVVYDPALQRLYVADQGNNRVVGFDLSNGITNNMPASWVLGQSNFTSGAMNGGNCVTCASPSVMDAPTGLAFDSANQHLFVWDEQNIRILGFDLSGGITNGGMNASWAWGEPDLYSNHPGPNCSRSTFGGGLANGMAYDPANQRLFFADTICNRVLGFDLSVPTNQWTGESASWVLGQTSFNSGVSATTQNGLNYPVNVNYDAATQKLFVTDEGNQRLLLYDLSSGITNGMNASDVFGQSNFKSNSAPAPGQNTLFWPRGTNYDPTTQTLFVSDPGNYRILIFKSGQGCVGGSGPSGGNPPTGGGLPTGCGASPPMICGSVSAEDSPGVFLPNVPLQIRDSQGNLLATTKTSSSGGYGFGPTGLTSGGTYYVVPMVEPKQNALPQNYPVLNLPANGITANFGIIGWAGTLQVTGLAGSFVLISTASYTGALPPAVASCASAGSNFFSASIGLDGTASVPVPAGSSYYATYWTAQGSGTQVNYNRFPAVGSTNLGVTIIPGQVTAIAGPS